MELRCSYLRSDTETIGVAVIVTHVGSATRAFHSKTTPLSSAFFCRGFGGGGQPELHLCTGASATLILDSPSIVRPICWAMLSQRSALVARVHLSMPTGASSKPGRLARAKDAGDEARQCYAHDRANGWSLADGFDGQRGRRFVGRLDDDAVLTLVLAFVEGVVGARDRFFDGNGAGDFGEADRDRHADIASVGG